MLSAAALPRWQPLRLLGTAAGAAAWDSERPTEAQGPPSQDTTQQEQQPQEATVPSSPLVAPSRPSPLNDLPCSSPPVPAEAGATDTSPDEDCRPPEPRPDRVPRPLSSSSSSSSSSSLAAASSSAATAAAAAASRTASAASAAARKDWTRTKEVSRSALPHAAEKVGTRQSEQARVSQALMASGRRVGPCSAGRKTLHKYTCSIYGRSAGK